MLFLSTLLFLNLCLFHLSPSPIEPHVILFVECDLISILCLPFTSPSGILVEHTVIQTPSPGPM